MFPIFQIPMYSDSHPLLVQRAKRWLLNTIGCGFVLTELSSHAGEIPDAIGFKHGYSYLVECKASRSDFLSDKRKLFRKYPEYGMGNYRYYLCLPDLIRPEELPNGWGLLYAHSQRVKVVLKAVKIPDPVIAVNDRLILCSALRRIHIRGGLEQIYDNPYASK